MKLITRPQWGARRALAATGISGTRGVKIHYTGDRENPAMLDDHDLCSERVRQIQAAHMDGRGWNDIAYSLVACSHGYVFAGRGPHILTAANGPGLNTGHYSICALIGNKGITQPNDLLLNAIRDGIQYLRNQGNAGAQIKGHRDGYSTDCPGDPLYAWVQDGAPRPGGSGDPNHDDDEGDPMYRYVSLSRTTPLELQPGKWTTISFDKEHSDAGDQHTVNGPGLVRGPASYSLSATLRLGDMGAGHAGQIRAVEVNPKKPADVDQGPIREWTSSDGDTFVGYDLAADKTNEGKQVQLQVVHWGPAPVRLVGASVKAHVWT